MIFQGDLLDAVLDGRKTVTRRICVENPRSPWYRERCTFIAGQVKAAQRGRGKPREANVLIEDVRREALAVLIHGSLIFTETEIKKEGFESFSEFCEAWKQINGPATWASRVEVWRIEFRFLERVLPREVNATAAAALR